MRGRAGSVPKISVFATEISVSGLEILPYEHFILVTGMNGGMTEYWRSGQHRLSMPTVFFHIISIPFNCSDTASRVTEALIGPKVKILVFHHVCFVSRIWHQNSSLGSLAVSRLGNRAEISLISQGEIQPGNRISRVNRTHMKRS